MGCVCFVCVCMCVPDRITDSSSDMFKLVLPIDKLIRASERGLCIGVVQTALTEGCIVS